MAAVCGQARNMRSRHAAGVGSCDCGTWTSFAQTVLVEMRDHKAENTTESGGRQLQSFLAAWNRKTWDFRHESGELDEINRAVRLEGRGFWSGWTAR